MKAHVAALILIVAAGLQAQSTSAAAAATAARREMVWTEGQVVGSGWKGRQECRPGRLESLLHFY